VYDNPALARTAKVFEKRVESLQQVEKPKGDGKKMKFRFLIQPPKGNIALEANGYKKQFEGHEPLLENVSFLISKGERVAMVGNNGTGKSSLLKDVVDHGRWENEVLRVGKSVQVGYFAQLGENLDLKCNLVENAMKMTGLLRGNATDLLYRFLFSRDDLEKPVSVLSGGEKARLQLAVLVSSGADMLLLDEPTNHLDIPSREAVEDALEEFPGTLVFVSHDRYFLDKLSDMVIHFVPPDAAPYEGNFTEFWEKRKKNKAVDKPLGHSPMDGLKLDKSNKEKKEKAKTKRIKFDPHRFNELEMEIHRLEELRPEVEKEWRTLDAKGKTTRAEHRRKRLAKIDSELEGLYEEWMMLGEKKKKWK
jgi:ATP-binding cassette, subfamily F, member 3